LNRRQLIIAPRFLQVRQFDALDLTRPNFNKLSAVAGMISSPESAANRKQFVRATMSRHSDRDEARFTACLHR
jgi:hypothetical protein